jgi:hypothetical protein
MFMKELKAFVAKLDEASAKALEIVEREVAEKWTRKYINDLPNAAFAVVEKGYSEGKSKGARHLPHHSKGVKSATENSSVDLSHYRNALARANQIKSVLKTESDGALRKKAANHLKVHRAVLKKSKSSFSPTELLIWEDCEKLYKENILPLLADE